MANRHDESATRRAQPRLRLSPEARLSLRAAFCISVPLLVGLLIHQRLYAIVASIGALWAISQDGLDAWPVRGPRLLWVVAAGGLGVALGSTFVGHVGATWETILFVGVIALFAGFVDASNHATAGAYLLIGTILGVGLEFTGQEWQSTLAIMVGALWVYVVAALMDRLFHLETQRIYLARAFDALATTVSAVGTPAFFSVRAQAVATIDRARDVVGEIHLESSSMEERSLYQCLIVALRCGEAISYFEGKNIQVGPSVADALRDVARTLETDGATAAVSTLAGVRDRFSSAPELTSVVAHAFEVTLSVADPHAVIRYPTKGLLPVTERLRFGLILAIAVTAGLCVSHVLNGPHGFWLPLAVAFILRPDVGPVITRAIARTVGTTVGVGIAAIVAWTGNTVLELIILSCVMAAIQPWAQRRSHTLSVITFTPVVFVFLGLLGTDKNLFSVRIIDTAIGAAIVLLLDILLWTTAPSLRPAQQLADARAASERYGDEAQIDSPIRRHQLRRIALRSVANARSSVTSARSEPRVLRRLDPTSATQLNDIERSIDAHTVALLDSGKEE
jgi:uncharacterized membrane protein YccC